MATTAEVFGEVPFFAVHDGSDRAAVSERVDEKIEVVLGRQRSAGKTIVLETAEAGDFFGEIGETGALAATSARTQEGS